MATSKMIEIAWLQLSQVDLSKDRGPLAGYGQVDFTTGLTPQTLDFQYPEQKGLVSAIAGIFVDNFDNGFPITITLSGTQQRLAVPAFAQALLPLASKSPELMTFDSPGANVIVRFQFLNFRPGSPLVWGAKSGGASPSAPTFVSDIQALNLTWSNVALGANQVIVPANAAGQVAIIKAPSINAASAWLNWGAPAAANTFMELAPGDTLTIGRPGIYDPRAINIFGTAPDRVAFGYG